MMITFKDYVAEKEKQYAQEIKKLGLFKNRKFVIVQVGSNNEASNRYVRNKLKDCEKIFLPAELISLPENILEAELISKLQELNLDETVSSYIVQLPLPKHISENKVINAIDPVKDADGFTLNHLVEPATPAGIMLYLKDNNYQLANKTAIVIGRSNIVGKPLCRLLLNENATVIQMHSKTTEEQKQELLPLADYIFTAAGCRHLLTNKYKYKSSAVIIDCGINFDEEGKLCGDCDKDLLVAIQSSSPGSVGLTTRLQLLINAVTLEKLWKIKLEN